MTPRLKLPIGVDLFEKLRQSDYYYVDKSLFIKELLDNRGEVNFFYSAQALRQDAEHEYAESVF